MRFKNAQGKAINIRVTPTDQWILETLDMANRSHEDTHRVYRTMSRYVYDTRDFYGVLEMVCDGVLRYKCVSDIADDCFFSVSMFSPMIIRRSRRHGAPGVRYYSRMGRSAFEKCGYPGVAREWDFWISYVQEHFVL